MIDLLGNDKKGSVMPLSEGDEKVEGNGILLILTYYHELIINRLLTRLPVLLAQIKAGNIFYKLKNEINQCYIFCMSIKNNQKTLQKFNQVVLSIIVIIKDNKLAIITEPKTIHFESNFRRAFR